MKYLILILSIVFSTQVLGKRSLQIGFGSITPHITTTKKNYCNQWNNSGVIVNKTYYLSYYVDNIGFTYLTGDDSICSKIEGLFFHYFFSQQDWVEYGITLGGYSYNQTNWDNYAEKTPSGIDAPSPVSIDYFGREVVPVVALSVNFVLVKRGSFELKLNNLLTPIITNHSLGFNFYF